MDELLQDFVAETRETLETLSSEIVAWEAAPTDRARLDAIFRFVHTVKGSCGFLDLPRLERLSHAAEDVLAAVRDGKRTPDTGLVDAVLAIVDRIGEIVEAIDAGVALDDSGEDLLIAALAEGAVRPVPVATSAPAQRTPTRSVRLGVELLDRMMSGMSEMVLARNDLARRLRDEATDPAVDAALERLSATVADMRDTVTRTRMQTIDSLFSALPRMVRDTAAELGKQVALTVEGGEVELDREMIEMMRDPLVHIVRNALDHGIEPVAERRAAGKRETGELRIAARQSGNQIVVEIADDGRGIDVERVIAKVAASGRASERELRQLNDREQLDLIFEAGLSTSDAVTAISGRGVGMDVVRANVEQIGGRIELTNDYGRGLVITIHVPLTLSIISTIGVGVGDQRFAVPRQAIEELVRIDAPGVRIDRLGDATIAQVRDRRLPLVDFATLAGIEGGGGAMLAIVSATGGSLAIAVDRVLDVEELVIKPATPAVMVSGLFAGQTLPDSGMPMLLVDCGGVALAAGLRFQRTAPEETAAASDDAARPDALLLRDRDGVDRLIPLAVVDRVEPIDPAAVQRSGGRLRMTADGNVVPLFAIDDLVPTEGQVLRLRDGGAEIAYAIADALDIVPLPAEIAPAATAGPVLGVVALDGAQVEVIDAFWLFGNGADRAAADRRPLCLIGGQETEWFDAFLTPVLEAAGYRVRRDCPPGETATVALAMVGDEVPASAVPLVRLATGVGTGSAPYRYDRAAILAALAAAGGRP